MSPNQCGLASFYWQQGRPTLSQQAADGLGRSSRALTPCSISTWTAVGKIPAYIHRPEDKRPVFGETNPPPNPHPTPQMHAKKGLCVELREGQCEACVGLYADQCMPVHWRHYGRSSVVSSSSMVRPFGVIARTRA